MLPVVNPSDPRSRILQERGAEMPKDLINKIGRREFMGSAVGAWSLMNQPAALSAGSSSVPEESSGNATTDVYNKRREIYLTSDAVKVKPAFLPLPPGAVIPKGWLRDWAVAAANGITGHLDEHSSTFERGMGRPLVQRRGCATSWRRLASGAMQLLARRSSAACLHSERHRLDQQSYQAAGHGRFRGTGRWRVVHLLAAQVRSGRVGRFPDDARFNCKQAGGLQPQRRSIQQLGSLSHGARLGGLL